MDKNEILKEAKEILKKPYARQLVPDETGGYAASIQEFPGCFAEGDTPEEAILNLEKAASSWVEVALYNEYEIREPVTSHGYSGKIALRIPRRLHKEIAELAESEECSINQVLVSAISQYLGGELAYKKMLEVIAAETQEEETSISTVDPSSLLKMEVEVPNNQIVENENSRLLGKVYNLDDHRLQAVK